MIAYSTIAGTDPFTFTGGNTNHAVQESGGGVWRVPVGTATNSALATRVAQINGPAGNGRLLEGVLTVPNDPGKYGPWAGKILTCAEKAGLIYAADTNRTLTAYNLGLGSPEDVRLIPSGQNLYCLDFNFILNDSKVLKVTADNFTSFAGDILLVDEGVGPIGCTLGGLYIVHWEGGRFVVRQIPVGRSLENVQFAPINIPALP